MTTTLDHSIIIPASVRDAFKARVVEQDGFEALRLATGLKTRDLRKSNWIDMANALGLAGELRALIETAPDWSAPAAPAEASPASPAPASLKPVESLKGEGEASPVDSDVESVLSTLRPFVAPSIIRDLESKLRPIAEAAHKPAEIVEVERSGEAGNVVALRRSPASSRPAPAPVRQCKRFVESTFRRTFGVNSKHGSKTVQIWDGTEAEGVPALDPYYVIDPALLVKFGTSVERNESLWLCGPMGSGKSSLPQEYAARTSRPFVRIAFQRSTEVMDIVGMKEIDGASMLWVDGVFTQAIRRAGTVILLDELMFAPPGVAALFQTVLDKRSLTLSTGEVVKVADGVCFVVADNTNGSGDETGLYHGTQQANAALVDRMGRMLKVDYLSPALEASALRHHTQAPAPACERLVDFVGKVRLAAEAASGSNARPLSLRRLVAFVRAIQDGFGSAESWDMVALSRLPDADAETLRQTVRAQFDAAAFEAEMKGEALAGPAAPVSDDPAQRAARSAFDAIEDEAF